MLDGAGDIIAAEELEDKPAAGKREQAGSDRAKAEASDVHWDSYLT